MIEIRKSQTADTRSCNFADVSKETLLTSSHQHINDVRIALSFFGEQIAHLARIHDHDKISDIDSFHHDFIRGFKEPYTTWWARHRQIHNRHHLNMADGVRDNVNLLDVLDHIADCVMAGMARTGEVFPLKLSPELLEKAFQNTVKLLKENVKVIE